MEHTIAKKAHKLEREWKAIFHERRLGAPPRGSILHQLEKIFEKNTSAQTKATKRHRTKAGRFVSHIYSLKVHI